MGTSVRKVLLALMAAVFAVIALVNLVKVDRRDAEIERLKAQVVDAALPVKFYYPRDTIRDTVEVTTSPVSELERKTLKRQHIIDESLIKDLRLKVAQLEAMQTLTIETRDSVKAAVVDSSRLVFCYADRWADIRLSVPDTTFSYVVRDSLETIVYREYKHRFLWWRWGTKGYKVKVVNFNPHATVKYNDYLMVK